MHTIGVYGTLKEGCYNHSPWGLDKAKRLGTIKIRGAMDLAMGGYPRLYAIGDAPAEYEREHDLEIYEIDDDTFSAIESMELGARYYTSILEQQYSDEDVHVFLMDSSYPFKPERFLEEYKQN